MSSTEIDTGTVPQAWPFPLTAQGNADLLVHLYGAELAHVTGVCWHIWDPDQNAWIPNGTSNVPLLAYTAIGAMRSFAETIASDEDAPKLLRHAQRSDDTGPVNRMIRLAQTHPRVARDPATFDPEHYIPVKVDPDWPVINHAVQSFYPSRYAAKLWDRFTFARTGSPIDLRSKLWILRDDEYVLCDKRWWSENGPLELGGEWRALYGSLTAHWLTAMAPELAHVQVRAAADTAIA